jgi:hypothetical protein
VLRALLLAILLAAALAVTALWAWSLATGGGSAQVAYGEHQCHVVSRPNALDVTIFRQRAEDPLYHQWHCPYWFAATLIATLTVLTGWWWRQALPRTPGRGFPVE